MRELADELNTTLTQDLTGSVHILNPIERISSGVSHHDGEIRLITGEIKKVTIRFILYDDKYSWSTHASVSKRSVLFLVEFNLPSFRGSSKT